MDVDIRRLSPDLAEDYLNFFESELIPLHTGQSHCYCVYFHQPTFDAYAGAEHRALALEMIRGGKLNGYLAYIGGKPAAWCGADDKAAYARLSAQRALWFDEARVKSVVCFHTAPAYRRQGLAKALLARVCDGARRGGYDAVEAYPAKAAGNKELYRGAVSMYERAGFEIVLEAEESYIVRKRV